MAISVLFLPTAGLLHGEAKVGGRQPAGWIRPLQLSDAPPKTEAGYDTTCLLADQQSNLASDEHYRHFAYRINTASGVQTSSHLEFTFDPAYQTLNLHTVQLIRDGRRTNKLDLEKVQVVQQEKELERFSYNGRLTALILLEDVRVGDVVEYAYTRTGRNPVLGAHFDQVETLNLFVPLERYEFRLLAPAGRQVHSHQIGDTPLEYVRRPLSAALVEHRWSAPAQKPAVFESRAPSWHSFLPELQVTDFDSWADVVAWARPLYDITTIEPAVAAKARELTAGRRSPVDKARALLDFVQSEVRYLGIEMGPHSHAPEAPGRVLARRYGDCKDKSRLLCALLEAVGIDAVPALVNSSRQRRTADLAPSTSAFDHAIVRIQIGGVNYWVDPTLSDQQGSLPVRNLPAYGVALPLQPGVAGLVEVRVPPAGSSRIDVTDEFMVADLHAPAALNITTTYAGSVADSMRQYLRNTPPETIANNILNSLVRRYPESTILKPPTWSDDSDGDVIRVKSSFRVKQLWKETDGSAKLSANFYPALLGEMVASPDTRVRRSPYGLAYPLTLAHRTVVHLPRPWPAKDQHHVIDDPAFRGESIVSNPAGTLILDYSYTALSDHVEAARMAEFAGHLRQFGDQLGYALSFDPVIAARNARYRLNWAYLAGLLAIGVFWAVAAVGLNRQPWGLWKPDVAVDDGLRGLRGWLILVGFNVVARPLAGLTAILQDHGGLFDGRKWDGLDFPLQAAVIAEKFFQLGILAAGILAIPLFFRQRRLFPLVFVGTLLFQCLFLAADLSWGAQRSPDPAKAWSDVANTVSRELAALIVWGTYFLRSQRAKATFTEEHPASAPPVMVETTPPDGGTPPDPETGPN